MEVMQSLSYPRDLMCALEAWALEQRPVFIVGVPRSGTTRLSNIISSSPEFSRERGDAVETHLVASLPNFYKWKDPGPLLRYLGGKSGVDSIIDRGIKTLRDSSPDRKRKAFVQLYFFAMMHACQPKRIVEKTPLHIFSADFLWCCFPKAQFVCCYRDPRAVYGSMRRRRQVELDRGKKPDDWLNQSPADFAKFYRDITRQFLFLKAKLDGQILPFPYEGFVAAPDDSLRVLFEKLESAFEPEAMTADHFEQGNTSDPLLYQPVADYGQYWDEFVRPADAAKIQEICGGDLETLGRWSSELGFSVPEARS